MRLLASLAVLLAAPLVFAETLVPPKLIDKIEPEYPAEALAAGIEATVMLEMIVDENGAVASAKVIAPAGNGFDESALAAAKKMRFTPGTADGKPVPVKVTWKTQFRMKQKPPPPPPSPNTPPPPPPERLVGDIAERGTRTPLEGVAVLVTDDKGAVIGRGDSGDGGRFSVRLPSSLAGKVTVVLAAPDHRTEKITETLKANEVVKVRYTIARSTYAQYESTVRGEPVREEIARVSLDGEEVRRIPGTRGDALAAVLNLPSVARSPFDLGQLVIRGSQPGESGAFILGMSIPQTFHFGLGTSTFNSFLLERFDLIPSNFSVRYGRFVGGVVDIVPRDPKKDRWHGDLKLDLYDAHAIAEGPVGKGSMALSVRRSYVDAVLGLVLPAGSVSVAPRYYDYQGLLTYPLGGGKLRLIIFGSDDELVILNKNAPDTDPSLQGQFGTRLWFHTLIAGYTRKWKSVEADVALQVGGQHQDAAIGQAARFNLDLVVIDLRAEARWKYSKQLKITTGLDLQTDYFWVSVDAPNIATEEATQGPLALDAKHKMQSQGYEGAPGLYVQADWQPHPRVLIVPGFRVDWFASTAGTWPQPRLMSKFLVADRVYLKAGVGLYTQPPQPPYADPVLGNPRIRPEQAIHVTVGVEASPIKRAPSFRIELNVFYKDLRNLAVESTDNVVRDNKIVPEVYIDSGIGRVYGADLLIKHDGPRWVYGWLAYTIAKAERQDTPGGAWRPFQYDQTHILTLVAGYHLPRDFDIGIRLRYVTGNPDTALTANGLTTFVSDQDVYVPRPAAPYSSRLPDFFQLDVRIDKRFVFKKWIFAMYLDVSNVTNRGNVEAFAYSYDYARRTTVTGLPILPSLGLRASF